MSFIKYLTCIWCLSCSSFVFANTLPVVLTSDVAGKNWVVQSKNNFTNGIQLLSLTQRGNEVIAAGLNYDLALIAKSNDKGITWTTGYPYITIFKPVGITANDKGALIGGNGQYNQAYLNYSVDNNVWKMSMVSSSYDCETLEALSGFAANQSAFLAAGTCKYFNPKDGRTFSRATLLTSADATSSSWQVINNLPKEVQESGASINTIAWDKDKWIALATTANHLPVILMSTDLNTWTRISIPADVKLIKSIATNGDEWIAIGKDNTDAAIILRSQDKGKNWQIQKNFAKELTLNQIRRNATNWIAVGKLGDTESRIIIFNSVDGVTWKEMKLPNKVSSKSKVSTLNDLIWTGENWIAVGSYDDSMSPCNALKRVAKWTGQLQYTPANKPKDKEDKPSTISVSDFKAWSDPKSEDGKTYPAYASIDYTGSEGGQFGFGVFDGTCIENEDGSVNLNLIFRDQAITATRKSADDNKLIITSSCLPDEHKPCLNFMGTLSGDVSK